MRDDRLRLGDIVFAIDHVLQFTSGKTRDDMAADLQLLSAVLYQLSIIGEATANVSRRLKSKYPAVDWRAFSDFRNEILHDYFTLDIGIVWDTIQTELPKMRAHLTDLLRTEFPE